MFDSTGLDLALASVRAREEELKNLSDYDKRRSLFLSWLGQADKCIRKGFLQDDYYLWLFWEWIGKAEKLLSGAPIEECKGKVKVKGRQAKTKKERLKWKAEHKTEIRDYRNRVIEKYNGKKNK